VTTNDCHQVDDRIGRSPNGLENHDGVEERFFGEDPGNGERLTWLYWVRHYDDLEVEKKYLHLVWRLVNGDLWVGPATAAPAGAEMLGVQYPHGFPNLSWGFPRPSNVHVEREGGGSYLIWPVVFWVPVIIFLSMFSHYSFHDVLPVHMEAKP